MKNKGYSWAIKWLVDNTDTDWVRTSFPVAMEAHLLADMYEVDIDRVHWDVERARQKRHRELGRGLVGP